MRGHFLSAIAEWIARITKTKNARSIVSAILGWSVRDNLYILASMNGLWIKCSYSLVFGVASIERLQKLGKYPVDIDRDVLLPSLS
jgi:hypothetical protein